MAKQDNKAEGKAQDGKSALVKATVKTSFHDKDDFDKVYEVGDTVEFDQERIDALVSLNLVEGEQKEEPKKEENPK